MMKPFAELHIIERGAMTARLAADAARRYLQAIWSNLESRSQRKLLTFATGRTIAPMVLPQRASDATHKQRRAVVP